MRELYQDAVKVINCPQCGYPLDIYFRWSKLILCKSCKSSIFLGDEGAELIGKASTLSPEPTLIQTHKPFTLKLDDNNFSGNYTPIGKIRYSYGRGFWEEWVLIDSSGKEFWLSVDEGDFLLEKRIKKEISANKLRSVKAGDKFGEYLVSEVGEGECVGYEGELPFSISIGSKLKYIHFSRGEGKMMTIDIMDEKTKVFIGLWIDPLTIKVSY